MAKTGKFDSIQALRAFAAVGVVAYHVSGNVMEAGWSHRWFHALSLYGVMGVDVFFVVSGFVMALVTADVSPGLQAAAAFAKARILRVVPMYWAMTALFIMLALLLPAIVYEPLSLSKLVTSFLFIPHLNEAGKIEPVLYVGWTLYYEMWFYLVFAAALCFFRRSLAAVTVILVLTSVLRLFGPGGALLSTYTNPIVLEFVAGAWLGVLYARGHKVSVRAAIMVMVIALASHEAIRPVLTETNRFWVFGVPAFAFACLFLSVETRMRWGVLVELGDASYSIYLAQVFSVPIAIKVAVMLNPARSVSGEAICVAATVAATFAGVVAYRLIERPLNRAARRIFVSGQGVRRLADRPES